jgi:predicted dehydrogenase/nucleoside-diphosphate-sugar epimerase
MENCIDHVPEVTAVVRGSQPLRIAFVGAGNIAGLHLHALRRVPTAHTIVGVHDVRPGAAQALAQRAGTRAYATLPTLLEETRPDLAHICTPAGMHFEPARQALLAGAHVYVEKPFVETREEADTLFALARQRGLLICAGHQLVRDPAFRQLMRLASDLGPITLVDSYFAFRPPRLEPHRSSRRALGEQLLDVLPHPLYTLVAALEGLGPAGPPLKLVNASVTPTELHALLRAGELSGRLCVSLRARPVASTLSVVGAEGTLTTDFVRAIVLGAANEGTSPLEKIANPFLEAAQLAWRSAASLAKRLVLGADYPGLAELLGEFYAAAAAGSRSPLSPDHLRSVTLVYEELAANVRSSVAPATAAPAALTGVTSSGQLAVVTGAAGFFSRAISRELARRGFHVRGIGRSERPDGWAHDWVRADLAEEVPADALDGAAIVVHAAAETAGGFDAHERNTVGAMRQVLRAMASAHVRRLVLVSSISVLRPPRPFWERQTERTPRAARPERLGPYTWGKCLAEELADAAQAWQEIEVRTIRPAALIDWEHLELPGLLGRRLFGHWHLGLGRPGLPFAICEVGRAGAVIAWCADHFADAPRIVNLVDPAIRTRGQLLTLFRQHGWRGHVVWVPISLLAGAVMMARSIAAFARREQARPLSVWSVLRPRRYDPRVAATVLAAARDDPPSTTPPSRAGAPARVSRAYA